MQHSQMFNMPKNAISLCFHHQLLNSTLETQIRHMQLSQMFNLPINAFWKCFHNQLLKYTLGLQVKAYAAFANVQHAEKRYLAVFSSLTLEIYPRNANKDMCSICKCSTRRKTLFEVFPSLTFEIYSRNEYKGIYSILKCSTCRKMLFGCVCITNFRNLL